MRRMLLAGTNWLVAALVVLGSSIPRQDVSLAEVIPSVPALKVTGPADTGVYTEDFTTYTAKDYTENSEWDIWANRLGMSRPDGLWQVDPTVTANLLDGSLLAVWHQSDTGHRDIYAQKLDANGNKLWAADVRVNSDSGAADQSGSAVAVEGGGNAVVVWHDTRNGGYDIYAQKLDAGGNKLWAADVRINSDSGTEDQALPAVTVDGGGNAVVVWADKRNGNYDIYSQKLDVGGNKLWSADMRVNSDSGAEVQWSPAVGVDGSGNSVVVWEDYRNDDCDIYSQKLDEGGSKLWAADVRVNSDSGTAYQDEPAVGVDGSGNAVVVWEDYRNGDFDIYAQKLGAGGSKLWAVDVRVNSDSGTVGQCSPAVGVGGGGNAVVVWLDYRNDNTDIYAQKLEAGGNKLWSADVRVNSDSGAVCFGGHTVAVDGGGNAVVGWVDGRNVYYLTYDLYAQKLDAGGKKLWSVDVRVAHASGAANQWNAAVAVDGGGNTVVVWVDGRYGGANIYAQKLDAGGNKLWAPDVRINSDSGPADQYGPAVGVDGGGNAVVAWRDYRNDNGDLYAQKLDAGGNRLWPADVRVNSDSGAAVQRAPAVGVDGGGNAVVVWDDRRNDDGDIYDQKLDGSGNKLWSADVRVNSDSGVAGQHKAAVVVDGAGDAVVVWDDGRSDNADIYAQKLDVGGNKLWAADVRVNSDSGTAGQKSPAVGVDGGENAVVVWEDYRNDDTAIYAQNLDAGGNKLWAEDVRVDSDSETACHFPPAVAVDGGGNAVVVWEGAMDIYAQRVNPNGGHLWAHDCQVVFPDLFYFPTGIAQSRTVDAVISNIHQAILTADYQASGGGVQFYLTNDGGACWAGVTPGITHVFTTTGSDLRWRAALCVYNT